MLQEMAQRNRIVIGQARKPRPIAKPGGNRVVKAQLALPGEGEHRRCGESLADTRRHHSRLGRHGDAQLNVWPVTARNEWINPERRAAKCGSAFSHLSKFYLYFSNQPI